MGIEGCPVAACDRFRSELVQTGVTLNRVREKNAQLRAELEGVRRRVGKDLAEVRAVLVSGDASQFRTSVPLSNLHGSKRPSLGGPSQPQMRLLPSQAGGGGRSIRDGGAGNSSNGNDRSLGGGGGGGSTGGGSNVRSGCNGSSGNGDRSGKCNAGQPDADSGGGYNSDSNNNDGGGGQMSSGSRGNDNAGGGANAGFGNVRSGNADRGGTYSTGNPNNDSGGGCNSDSNSNNNNNGGGGSNSGHNRNNTSYNSNINNNNNNNNGGSNDGSGYNRNSTYNNNSSYNSNSNPNNNRSNNDGGGCHRSSNRNNNSSSSSSSDNNGGNNTSSGYNRTNNPGSTSNNNNHGTSSYSNERRAAPCLDGTPTTSQSSSNEKSAAPRGAEEGRPDPAAVPDGRLHRTLSNGSADRPPLPLPPVKRQPPPQAHDAPPGARPKSRAPPQEEGSARFADSARQAAAGGHPAGSYSGSVSDPTQETLFSPYQSFADAQWQSMLRTVPERERRPSDYDPAPTQPMSPRQADPKDPHSNSNGSTLPRLDSSQQQQQQQARRRAPPVAAGDASDENFSASLKQLLDHHRAANQMRPAVARSDPASSHGLREGSDVGRQKRCPQASSEEFDGGSKFSVTAVSLSDLMASAKDRARAGVAGNNPSANASNDSLNVTPGLDGRALNFSAESPL
ncbi:hypothetical protein DIPPA_34182 [Diplonema papillatum]|nr:hypothetical protein DIPPA_34182 [Diplonema papillatum]